MRLLLAAAALTLAAATTGSAGATTRLRGTITYGSFRSTDLRGSDHYAVYLPPGYGDSTRYPVIYFLHGLPAGKDAFRSENEQIERAFQAYHIPHVYFRIYEGGHSWSLWAEHAPAWIGGGLRFAAAPSRPSSRPRP